LPISTADSPKPLGEEPDLAIASLTEFFNKFNASRITPKSQDTEVIAHFLKFIPDGTPDYARDHVGHSLARGLDSLRRQVANAWVH
jgi:hypothetical protein